MRFLAPDARMSIMEIKWGLFRHGGDTDPGQPGARRISCAELTIPAGFSSAQEAD